MRLTPPNPLGGTTNAVDARAVDFVDQETKNILGTWGADLSDDDYASALAALGVLESTDLTPKDPSNPDELAAIIAKVFELGDRTPVWCRNKGPVAGLSPAADRASRVTVGHAEGFFGAFGNIYADLAEVLRAQKEGRAPDPLALSYPTAEDGLRTIAVVNAAARSAARKGAWEDAVPALLRA